VLFGALLSAQAVTLHVSAAEDSTRAITPHFTGLESPLGMLEFLNRVQRLTSAVDSKNPGSGPMRDDDPESIHGFPFSQAYF